MKSKLFRKLCSIALSALMIGGAAVTLPQVLPGADIEVSAANSETDFEINIYYDNTLAITGYHGTSSNVVIPATIYGKKVDVIESLGYANSKIVSISVPNGVKKIAYGALANLPNLKKVVLPDQMEEIGDNAFALCPCLETINLPKNCKFAGGIFHDCGSLKQITLPNGMTTIPRSIFDNCTSLESVYLPNSIKTIEWYAFYGCKNLKRINLPTNLEGISYGAFGKCSSLQEIHLPSSLIKIGEVIYTGAFEGCSSLKEVIIPNNVKILGANSFANCTNLEKVMIPGDLETIGDNAFKNCNKLTIYGIKNSVTNIYAGNNQIPFKPIIKTSGVAFNTSSIALNVNETYKITATVKPANATINTLTWKSSNTAVATVSADGTVTAKSGGTATITATTADNKSATCSVTVYGSPTSINLNSTQMSLGKGETTKLTATVGPQYAKDKTVKWRTSNSKVLTVDQSGNVKAVNNGTAWITATAKGNTKLEKSCKITVKNAPSKITLTKGILTIGVGESYTVGSSVNDGAACAKRTYRTSNSSIVKMTRTDWNGVFVGVKPGVAYVTVRTYNGKESTCKVTVKAAPSKVSLNKTAMTLKVGQKGTVSAIIPSNAGCATRTFRSSNNNVVQMTKTNWTGEFVAKNKGVAYVAVKTYNGKEAYCKVTVQ